MDFNLLLCKLRFSPVRLLNVYENINVYKIYYNLDRIFWSLGLSGCERKPSERRCMPTTHIYTILYMYIIILFCDYTTCHLIAQFRSVGTYSVDGKLLLHSDSHRFVYCIEYYLQQCIWKYLGKNMRLRANVAI